MGKFYTIIKKITNLVDLIGEEKTLNHIESIAKTETSRDDIKMRIKQVLGVKYFELQSNKIKTEEKHIALLIYTKYAREILLMSINDIAFSLKKTNRTIQRYIETYKDYEKDNISIVAKKFKQNYNLIKDK